MDEQQISEVAAVLREHVVDLFVHSIKNIWILSAWTLLYFVFGSVLGWVANRLLSEVASNSRGSILSIPLKDRLCTLIVVVFSLIGLKLALDKCEIDVTLFLYGGGSLPFLLLSWAIRDPLSNYFAAWTNGFLLGGDRVQVGSASGIVEFVGALHVHLKTPSGSIIRVPHSQFQQIPVVFQHSAEHAHSE